MVTESVRVRVFVRFRIRLIRLETIRVVGETLSLRFRVLAAGAVYTM